METKDVAGVMSPVIGAWAIQIQNFMPDEMRNSAEWKDALALALGTGQDPAAEKARLDLILDWMWSVVLPVVQPLADEQGFGDPWRTMLMERTPEAAEAAERAAWTVAWAAATGVGVERVAAWAAARAAARAVSREASQAGAARTVAWAAMVVGGRVWSIFDPPGLLRRLVLVEVGSRPCV